MNALAPSSIVSAASRSHSKGDVRCLGLLWIGVDAPQSIRAGAKALAVAYREWIKLQFIAVGSNMEQPVRMGWGRG